MSHQVESTEPPPAASTTHPEWGAVGILSVTTIPVPSAQSFVGYEVIVHGTSGEEGEAAGEGEGDGGGDMAAPATLNVCEPLAPAESVIDWPKPAHMLPFQPSPHESVIERVHVAPIATVAEPDHGAPPESVTPSEHESVQLTSDAYEPPPTLIVPVVVGGGGAPPGTMKLAEPLEPAESVIDWPKPVHMLPFQPSPHESVIESEHVAPTGAEKSLVDE